MFEDKVKEFASEYNLLDAGTIIVGVSGGADSVALLRVLCSFSKKIIAVHINHNLRGEAADSDQRFVEELCAGLGVELKVFSFDVRTEAERIKRSEEDTGRRLRYKAFEEVASAYEDFDIAVAHHKDDLTETFLMNLFRGSGTDGLCSPKPRNGHIVRPLLCVTKKEIIDYLNDIGQGYREDLTNFEENCTRNVWRNRIIPEIAEVSVKEPTDAVFETYKLVAGDLDFLNSFADNICSEAFNDGTADVSVLREQHPAIRSRVIRKLWEDTFGNLVDFEQVHLAACEELLDGSVASGTYVNMPFGRVAYQVCGRFGFCAAEDLNASLMNVAVSKGFIACDSEIAPKGTETLSFGSVLSSKAYEIRLEIIESCDLLRYNTISWFYPIIDGSEISSLRFGTAASGMRFKRAGSSAGKTFSKVLGEYKIPAALKDHIFAVSRGDDVLWIPGVGHSAGFTDDISKKRFFENDKNMEIKRFLAVTVSEVRL